MTEGQRDYLADLAGKKGVRIEDTDNVSAAWASAKIEELKLMPDAVFDEFDSKKTDRYIKQIVTEMKKWTFQV